MNYFISSAAAGQLRSQGFLEVDELNEGIMKLWDADLLETTDNNAMSLEQPANNLPS